MYITSVYFVITSFTSIGYGDIVPTTSCARGATAVMTVSTVVLTAVLVAMADALRDRNA